MKKIVFASVFILVLFIYGCGGGDDSLSHNGYTTDSSLANPAAGYCIRLGYKYDLDTDRCMFDDNNYCDAWDFYDGKCHREKTYCEQNGGLIKTVTDRSSSTTYEYAVCVFNDGSECLELDYLDHVCSPGQCDRWKLSEGGCIR